VRRRGLRSISTERICFPINNVKEPTHGRRVGDVLAAAPAHIPFTICQTTAVGVQRKLTLFSALDGLE
jgi:hypothetical protein